MAENYNSGAVWYNKTRRTEKSPGFSGEANIDGVAYFMDAWTRQTKDGHPWISVSFKKKDKQEGVPKVPFVREEESKLLQIAPVEPVTDDVPQ